MSHYQDDMRNRARSVVPPKGRFTPVRNGGHQDPNLILAQQRLQQQRSGAMTTPRNPPNRRMTGGAQNDAFMEMERMKRTIKSLQDQLQLADETIVKLKRTREKEKDADRTTAELKSQVQQSGKFESLSESGTRPTQIIEKYELLYTQGRLDAMDDLDQIAGLSKYGKHQEMKQKILYGIMVASYKVSYDYLHQVKLNLRRLLGIPDKHQPHSKDAFGDAVNFLTTYFQSTTQEYSVEPIINDVQDQLIQLLPEFPSLSRLPGIAKYTAECCRVAWSMVNQIPPMEMEHSQDKFCANMHTRFHASSDKNSKIKMYVWPALVESGTKNVLFKGVVWT